MFKKLGAIAVGTAAGMVMLGGMASASPVVGNDDSVDHSEFDQVGLLNLNNTDILHNVNAVVGVCDNNINVLGVQVPVEDVANGLNLPILSPGESENEAEVPDLCATGGILDGGVGQNN
ncbi:hypothetical protein UO65_3421 [Actinokineospora spheciospongiae]|uniref:Secreted protein n=1 Tax=Actinokineospora spheciospongiae TaxID=909613 RepID=W7IK93_9PSEU|nr:MULTISPECIES: hypothetical protein [Actinokineospora]EWC61270.1 hypothetical protein UO65_3421 [Actinokineospora spheciospongiae]MCG8919230.1 hypothetical protein [Actinokineospora sp. PR83]PWW62385.1 hypothetical protein DFQ13_105199 [Actinokineospora spheciospongiae]